MDSTESAASHYLGSSHRALRDSLRVRRLDSPRHNGTTPPSPPRQCLSVACCSAPPLISVTLASFHFSLMFTETFNFEILLVSTTW